MIIAIHQPNFMPWYPFFQKLKAADIFVILSHCQYRKNYFQNRFNIGAAWYTMSVKKGTDLIVNKQYANSIIDWNNIKSKLPQYSEDLQVFDGCITETLNDTNTQIIKTIAELLNIQTTIVQDFATPLTSTKRLIEICKNYEATTYLSGPCGSQYMDIDMFKANNIAVNFQNESDQLKKPILEVLNARS
jgi:hypothetical protein